MSNFSVMVNESLENNPSGKNTIKKILDLFLQIINKKGANKEKSNGAQLGSLVKILEQIKNQDD